MCGGGLAIASFMSFFLKKYFVIVKLFFFSINIYLACSYPLVLQKKKLFLLALN